MKQVFGYVVLIFILTSCNAFAGAGSTGIDNAIKGKNSQLVVDNGGESYFKTHIYEIYNELKNNWRGNKNFDVGRYCVKVSEKNEDDFMACMGMARRAYEELKTEW